jgi:hypothetical protein
VDVTLEEINVNMNKQLNSSEGAGIQMKRNFFSLQAAKCRVRNEAHSFKSEAVTGQDYSARQGAVIERMERW